jgi:hypothetical protein
MTKISTTTHPELTPAERRALRARAERHLYTFTESEVKLTRKSDGAKGRIRFVLVRPQDGGPEYTVRLRNNGDPCRCSCKDDTRRRELDPAAELCKHGQMILLAREPAQDWTETVTTEREMEAERVERARRDAHLWD